MKPLAITADQIHCPQCGTIIPKGHIKCSNPACPTNRPLYSRAETK